VDVSANRVNVSANRVDVSANHKATRGIPRRISRLHPPPRDTSTCSTLKQTIFDPFARASAATVPSPFSGPALHFPGPTI
jgi:hypothetical protein